jgi:hypothetical protein
MKIVSTDRKRWKKYVLLLTVVLLIVACVSVVFGPQFYGHKEQEVTYPYSLGYVDIEEDAKHIIPSSISGISVSYSDVYVPVHDRRKINAIIIALRHAGHVQMQQDGRCDLNVYAHDSIIYHLYFNVPESAYGPEFDKAIRDLHLPAR